MNEVYSKIKTIRIAKGLTQIDMAEKMAMTQGNYGRLEKGLIQVTIERLEQFSEVFQMSVTNILNYEADATLKVEDAQYYRTEVIRLERLLAKSKKEVSELQTESNNDWDKLIKEKEDYKSSLNAYKSEIKTLKERLLEKDKFIETLTSVINALTAKKE